MNCLSFPTRCHHPLWDWVLVTQTSQKRCLCLYSVGWKFPVRSKVFCSSVSSHFSSCRCGKDSDTDSLIPHQLKVFRNLRAQLFHSSPRESTNLGGPDLTSDPLCSGSQHRTASTGVTCSHLTEEGNTPPASQPSLTSPLPIGPGC